jgi:protein involved in polysaccharide export with SLBB domain
MQRMKITQKMSCYSQHGYNIRLRFVQDAIKGQTVKRVVLTTSQQVILAGLLFCAFGTASPSAQIESAAPDYHLGSGDQLRITFFGKHVEDLSGDYEIDGSGLVPMPLVGNLRLGGLTLAEAESTIKDAYQPDYVLNPRISIQVLNYRPFYIMGQVNSPGSYSYVNGITVLEAIVIAGGFTKRAKESSMTIIRGTDPTREKQDATPETVVLPGDVIEVPQRYF